MNSFKIIGFTKDFRTNTHLIYAQILVQEYFELIGEKYNKFRLQRKKEIHRGYKRLKEDLQKGALIPEITLTKEHNYIIIIPKLCAYWIYRVRSSIAHNKFGGYIMDKNDEEFIVEFAEPLLKSVVNQCFKV